MDHSLKDEIENYQCVLFLDSNLSDYEIVNEISKLLNDSIVHSNFIECNLLSIHVEKNDEHCEQKKYQNDEGFLYFKFRINLDKSTKASSYDYICSIDALISHYLKNETTIVAACNFEKQLKTSGFNEFTIKLNNHSQH